MSTADISNMNTFSIKLDQQLNPSNLINGRVFYGRNFQSSPAGNSGEIAPPNQPVDLFNSVPIPRRATLVGLVWNSTLSDHTLLEARVRIQSVSRRSDRPSTTRSIPTSLGINTGPLDAANFGVPASPRRSAHIGGVGGYPIFVTPSTDFSLVAIALTQTRGAHTIKIGGSWDRCTTAASATRRARR